MIPLLVLVGAAVALIALAAALNSASSGFGTNPCGSGPVPCGMPCQFAGTIQSVSFDTTILVARQQNTVAAPHWVLGQNVNDGAGSLRPAVYLVRGMGGHDVTVEVEITQSVNCGPTADLVGTLGGIEIRGPLSTALGRQTVTATIQSPPAGIAWEKGDITWGAEVPGCGSFNLGSTRAEIFFVLDTPIAIYQGAVGVWVEALRLLCQRAGVVGLTDKRAATAAVARYCHSSHGLRYDTNNGAPSYGVSGSGGTFDLGRYLVRAAARCNCYDQAAAVQSLSGAVGVTTEWNYLEPFGYLKTSNLVGVGSCNNPFFDSNGSTATVGANDANRTSFGNHAFCQYTAPAAPAAPPPDPKVLDACAGPHVATETRAQYISASIDTEADTTRYDADRTNGTNRWAAAHPAASPADIANVRAWYTSHWRPGTAADIQLQGGVTGVA